MGIYYKFRKHLILLFLYYIIFSCDTGDNEPACNMPTEEKPKRIPQTWSINIINTDGNDEIKLYEEQDRWMAYPQFTPNGSQIIYYCGRTIGIMDSDGDNRTVLTREGSKPHLSPDGTKIVYIRDGYIWIMNVDGDNVTQLTSESPLGDNPVFTPDGLKILYIMSRNIWMMDIDGSHKMKLTENLGDLQYFDISSDGLRIAYSAGVNNVWDIYLLDLGENKAINLTNDNKWYGYPHFSQVGSFIAYVCNSWSDNIYSQIYITDINGNNKYILYEDWFFGDLIVSPDGTKIAFNNGAGLNIIDIDSSNLTYLTDLGHCDWRAMNFSPDGRNIVYITKGEL